MGRKFSGERKDLIKSLNETHKRMAREIAIRGATPSQLAELFNYSPVHVSRIVNAEPFQNYLKLLKGELWGELKEEIREDLKLLTPDALAILKENLTSKSVDRKLKTQTALEILDRAGYAKRSDSPEQKHLHLHAHDEVQDMSMDELYRDITELIEEDD